MNVWLLVCCAVLTALEALTVGFAGRWAERGITCVLPMNVGAIGRLFAAFAAAVAVHNQGRGVSAATATAAAVWLAFLAADSDLGSRKIPREACWAVYVVGVGCAITGSGPAGWTSLGVALLVAYAPMALASRLGKGGMGYADVRLIIAFCLTLAWWAGAYPVMVGLILGCVLQLVFGHLAVRLIRGRATQNENGKRRRLLPFGPALSVGTVVGLVLALTSGQSACQDLAGIVGCG